MKPSELLEASRWMVDLTGSPGGSLYAAAREEEMWGSDAYYQALDCLEVGMDAHGGYVVSCTELIAQAGRILDVAISAALSDEALS